MKKSRKNIISIILILVFSATAVYSGVRAYLIYAERQSGKNTYTHLEQYVHMPPVASSEEPTDSLPKVDFESLREVNRQVVGWIYCEDTVISYPIAQAEDNDYYVNHLFDGQYNSTGCIFLDWRSSGDFSDRHSVIYGHHLRNGNMFAGLTEYKNQEYYESHPQFLLMTPQKNYAVEIFAGYVADIESDAWDLNFDSDEAYMTWLEKSIKKSAIQTGITPTAEDKVLTLSTCSYEFNNARFVLLGILREEI